MHVRKMNALLVLALITICAGRGVARAAAPAQQAPQQAPVVSEAAEAAEGAAAGPAAAAPPQAQEAAPEQEPEEELTTGEAFLLKLRQGGITMIFLFLASIAGLGYTIERFVNLRSSAIVPEGLAERADELWREGRYEELEALPEESNSTMARLLAVVARHRGSSLSEVRVMASDVASRELRRHSQKAYPLAVVATVSPLLGLLGTVIGMIGAFDTVAAAGSLGDASMLGGDISKALITTGTGLTIAVPALVLYHYFRSRTQMYALMLEEEVGDLIGSWYTEPAQERAVSEEAEDAG